MEENGDVSATFLFIVTFVGLYLALKLRRPKNFPPGPQGLPIFGYTPFLGKNASETFMEMKKQYGRVMSVQMGREYWIILNDYDSIKEVLANRSGTFSGRPYRYYFHHLTRGYGIINIDFGQRWKHHYKLGISTIRGFGVGRPDGEEKVAEEVYRLTDNLLDEKNKENVLMKLSLATSNVLGLIFLGKRFAYDDERFIKINKAARKFLAYDYDAKLLGFISLSQAFRHFPPFRGAFERSVKTWREIIALYKEIVKNHKESFEESNPRDFIDEYLKEIVKSGNDDSIFCEDQLVMFIRDIFEAGASTTSTAVAWIFLCFLNHPECQEKIASEVEIVLGEHGTTSTSCRSKMPYTCAFMQEMLRYKTLVPLGVTHKSDDDAIIDGYNIPRNTTVTPNIHAVHMDPSIFDNPGEFRPERFLNEDGEFVKSNHVIPFSVGPRKCMGEQLARVELFIFITGIVQKLKVLPDPENPPPSFNVSDLKNFFTLEPPDFSVKFEKRIFCQ